MTPPDLPDADALLENMKQQLSRLLVARDIADPKMVGVHTGGVWIAERLHASLGIQSPLGVLDIGFYRDDFTQNGLHPSVKPSALPFSVDDQDILLVDDVLMSGRTVRAALNELFDYGRPRQVILATLLDLQANQLPIRADVVGAEIILSKLERVKLRGPDPLRLELCIISG